jgi:hypothetical protein
MHTNIPVTESRETYEIKKDFFSFISNERQRM